jgi:hypothetical protein
MSSWLFNHQHIQCSLRQRLQNRSLVHMNYITTIQQQLNIGIMGRLSNVMDSLKMFQLRILYKYCNFKVQLIQIHMECKMQILINLNMFLHHTLSKQLSYY